jgi:DNA-binding transcriptional LysR family regulator
VAVADLRDHRLILAEPGSPLRAAVEAACDEAGFGPVPLFEVSDPWAVRFLTGAGLGVSVVPRSWIELPGPPLGVAELLDPAPRHRVSLLTAAAAAGRSPAAALLQEHLARALSDHGG